MLFYIDRTVSEELSNRKLSKQEYLFFVDLASACQHGRCFLSGDLESLSLLASRLGPPLGDIYLYAKGKRAEHGAIMRAVSTVFVLTFAEKPSEDWLPMTLKEDGKCWFLPISEIILNRCQLSAGCCLLTENLTDSKLYDLIAQHYCANANIRGLRLSFHHENGGGNTICDVLQKCVAEEKTPTLCIVDSDRKHGPTRDYPNEPSKGDTLNRVIRKTRELAEESSLPPFSLYPLHVHEAENLIPMQILKEQVDEYPEMEKGLKMLESLAHTEQGEPLLYYDLKLGFPFIKNEPQRAYWMEIMQTLGGTVHDMPPKAKKDVDAQTSLFFPPVCNHELLERSIKLMSEKPLEEINVDNHLAEIWNNIGMIMLTWGCANTPQSA